MNQQHPQYQWLGEEATSRRLTEEELYEGIRIAVAEKDKKYSIHCTQCQKVQEMTYFIKGHFDTHLYVCSVCGNTQVVDENWNPLSYTASV